MIELGWQDKIINRAAREPRPRFSVCVLVTRPDQFGELRTSFMKNGFNEDNTEYLICDNTDKEQLDAFAAYNIFLQEAKGDFVILCHQDVVLLDDGASRLEAIIAELDRLDPTWALLGNAGARTNNKLALRITDPNTGDSTLGGPFPARVMSLDENFIVAKKSANLCLSVNLCGFHWYGPDLCLMADIAGYSSYVVDFHLMHKSGGTLDASYWKLKREFERKYRSALRPRWMHVTTRQSALLSGVYPWGLGMRLAKRTSAALRRLTRRQFGSADGLLKS